MNKSQKPHHAKNRFFAPFSIGKYSVLGLLSFLIAILVALAVAIDVGLVQFYQNNPTILHNFETTDPFITLSAMFLAALGVALGLASIALKVKMRLFGIVGLIANGLFLLGIISLYIYNITAFTQGIHG